MRFNLGALKLTDAAVQQAIHNRDVIAKSLRRAKVMRAKEMARQCEADFATCSQLFFMSVIAFFSITYTDAS